MPGSLHISWPSSELRQWGVVLLRTTWIDLRQWRCFGQKQGNAFQSKQGSIFTARQVQMVRCSSCKNDFGLFPVCFYDFFLQVAQYAFDHRGKPKLSPQKHGINRICSNWTDGSLVVHGYFWQESRVLMEEIKESLGARGDYSSRVSFPLPNGVEGGGRSGVYDQRRKFTSFVSSQRIGDAILPNFTGVGIGDGNHRKSCH